MTTIGNRLLNSSYTGSVLTETKAKAIENKGTQTDQVLDLSGSPEQVAAELAGQDLNSIKAIKINNSLVTINPKQIENLVKDLKAKCLDSENKLKPDIKFANFQAVTGSNKVEINAVESKLAAPEIENIDKLNNQTDKIFSGINKDQLFNVNIENSNGDVKAQHLSKAVKIGAAITNIDKEITSLNAQIESLKSSDPNSELITDLEAKVKVLSSTKEVLTTNKEIHNLLGQIKNPPAPGVPTSPTNPAILNKLGELNNKLGEQINSLKATNDENSGKISDQKVKDNTSKIISGSEKSQEMTTDLIDLCKNQPFMNSLSMMGKQQSASLILANYKEYLPLAQLGQEAKEKGKVAGRQGVGETPDASGFINACANDVKYDAQGAANLVNMSDKITNGSFKTREEVKAAVEKMFKTTSGQYVINPKKAERVVDLYTKLFDAVQLNKDVTQLKGQVNSETKDLIQEQVSKAQEKYKELKAKPDISLAGTGFGPRVLGSSQQVTTTTNKNISEVNPKLETVNKEIEQVIKQETEEMTKSGKGIGKYIDKYLGFDSRVHVEIMAHIGAEGKVLGAGVDASVGVGIGATIEKTFGSAYTYTAHVDFKFSAKAEAKFGKLFSAELGYDYNKVLAGVGFNKASEIEALMGKFAQARDAAESGDDAKAESLYKEAITELSQRSYESSHHTFKTKMQLGDADHGHGLSVGAEVTSQRSTLAEPPAGKQTTVVDDTKSYEANFKGYKLLVKEQKSTIVNGKESDTPVAKSDATPYPVLKRHLVEVKIPAKVLAEAIKTGKMPDVKNLAHAMILANPALQEMGVDALAESLNKHVSNLITLPVYANVAPILGAYGTAMEAPHGHGHEHHGGGVHAHADITLGVDMVDDPDTGARKVKFELGVHGAVEGDTGKIAIAGKAAGDEEHKTGAQAYVQVKGKFEVAAAAVLGYTKIGKIPQY